MFLPHLLLQGDDSRKDHTARDFQIVWMPDLYQWLKCLWFYMEARAELFGDVLFVLPEEQKVYSNELDFKLHLALILYHYIPTTTNSLSYLSPNLSFLTLVCHAGQSDIVLSSWVWPCITHLTKSASWCEAWFSVLYNRSIVSAVTTSWITTVDELLSTMIIWNIYRRTTQTFQRLKFEKNRLSTKEANHGALGQY